jgi:hypothetical protein
LLALSPSRAASERGSFARDLGPASFSIPFFRFSPSHFAATQSKNPSVELLRRAPRADRLLLDPVSSGRIVLVCLRVHCGITL